LHVRPRPVQEPHPPLFVAANSEDSVRSAARLGLPTLSSYFVPVGELERRHALYREEALAAGRAPGEIRQLERQAWGMRVVHVGRSRAEAVQRSEPGFMGYQRRIAVLRSEGQGGGVPGSFDRSMVRLRPFQEYLDAGLAIIGDADDVRAGLRGYVEATGYQRVLLLMAIPGLDTGAALESMRIFAEEVAPAITPAAQRA
jgi:alkanesulfonate monooxygenase SsuD/methylene tetrahydromethanopterin reductase-like flavin-dependent oxidoreductase (luciferase family)